MTIWVLVIVLFTINHKLSTLTKLESGVNATTIQVDNYKAEILDLKLKLENKEKEIQELTSKMSKELVEKAFTSRPTISRGSSNRFQATAYCACSICCGKSTGITATGTKATEGRTIAVDPRVIPLGTKVFIQGYGERVAEDTGGMIKGNIIDVYFNSHQEALKFGRKNINLQIIY